MIGEAPFENGKVESVRALLNARTKFAILLLDYSLTKNRIIKISGMEKRTGQRSGARGKRSGEGGGGG